jgi:hypothetical protein
MTSTPYRSHINLAGDGGGDEGGPAFLQQVDGALGCGGAPTSKSAFGGVRRRWTVQVHRSG